MQVLGNLWTNLIYNPKVSEKILQDANIPIIQKKEIIFDRNNVIVTTGSGTFISGEYNNEQVSIKIVDITQDEAIINEFLLWKNYLGNSDFLQMKGVCIYYGEAFIVFENFQFSLETVLFKKILNFQNKIKITSQCLEILENFQTKGQTLKDIRPGIFAMTKNLKIKLIDFGILVNSEKIQNDSIIYKERIKYAPPEIFAPSNVNEENELHYDIWSFGCLLIDIFSLKSPLIIFDQIKEIPKLILIGKFPIIAEDINVVVNSIILRCLNMDCKQRIMIGELGKNLRVFFDNFSINNSDESISNDNDSELYIENQILNEHYQYSNKVKEEIKKVNDIINQTYIEEAQKMKNSITTIKEENNKIIKNRFELIQECINLIMKESCNLMNRFEKKIINNILEMQNYFSDALKDINDIDNKTTEIIISIKTITKFSNLENYQDFLKSIENNKEIIQKIISQYSKEQSFDKINLLYEQNVNAVEQFNNFTLSCSDFFYKLIDSINEFNTHNITLSNKMIEGLRLENEGNEDKDSFNNILTNKITQAYNCEGNSNFNSVEHNNNKNNNNNNNIDVNNDTNKIDYMKTQENSNIIILYNSINKKIQQQFFSYKFNSKSYSLYDALNNCIYISGGLIDIKDKYSYTNAFFKLKANMNETTEGKPEYSFSLDELAPMNYPRCSHSIIQLSKNCDILIAISGINTKTCEAYNTSLNIWKSLPDLPYLSPNAACCDFGDYLYVVCKNDDIEGIYRLALCSSDEMMWENVNYSMGKGKLRKGMSIANAGDEIYLFGGFDNDNLYDDIYIFSYNNQSQCFDVEMYETQKLPMKSLFNSNTIVNSNKVIMMNGMNEVIEFNINTKEFIYYS